MKPTSRRIAALAAIPFAAALLLVVSRALTLQADTFDSPLPVFLPYVSQAAPAAEPEQPDQADQSTTFASPLPIFLPYVAVNVEKAGPAWVCEPAGCP